VTKTRQQRTQHQHRSAHGLDQLIGRFGLQRIGRPKTHATALAVRLRLNAHIVQQQAHGGHIAQTRHVGQRHRFGGEQGGTQLGQGRVLGAGYGHFAIEGATTGDAQFVHGGDVFQ
jgi:hypothetical protein